MSGERHQFVHGFRAIEELIATAPPGTVLLLARKGGRHRKLEQLAAAAGVPPNTPAETVWPAMDNTLLAEDFLLVNKAIYGKCLQVILFTCTSEVIEKFVNQDGGRDSLWKICFGSRDQTQGCPIGTINANRRRWQHCEAIQCLFYD